MKITKIASVFLAVMAGITSVSASTLQVRSIVESGPNPLVQAAWPAKFGLSTSSQLNTYNREEAPLIRQIYYGTDLVVRNNAGQIVDAEWKLEKVTFSLYKDSVLFKSGDLTRFIQPGGGGTPFAVIYNNAGVKTSTELSLLTTPVTGSRFVIGEFAVSLGTSAPKQPLIGAFYGANYIMGLTITGSYKAAGESTFTPFSLLPGDKANQAALNTYYNYSAVIITPDDLIPSIPSWEANLVETILPRNGDMFQYSIFDSSGWANIPGGFDIDQETSTDLKLWTTTHPGSISYQGNGTWIINSKIFSTDSRRFFRVRGKRVPILLAP